MAPRKPPSRRAARPDASPPEDPLGSFNRELEIHTRYLGLILGDSQSAVWTSILGKLKNEHNGAVTEAVLTALGANSTLRDRMLEELLTAFLFSPKYLIKLRTLLERAEDLLPEGGPLPPAEEKTEITLGKLKFIQ